MRTYPEEARQTRTRTLAEFAPRYERPRDDQRRTVADIIVDALAVLHQDAAEYAFAAVIAAVAAAFAAIVLPASGGIVGAALVPPAVFTVATLMYAHSCAAVRRAQENLEPDAIRAFFAVLARLPAILPPLTLPLALSGATVLVGAIAAKWAPNSVVTLAAVIVFAVCGVSSFQRSLYVPALFARNVNFAEARALGAAAMKTASALIGACFVIALAPAALLALLALATQFNPATTAVASFALVASMPVTGAVATLVFEGLAPQLMAQTRRARRVPDYEERTAERLTRRYTDRRR
jgi:hypothetical protein